MINLSGLRAILTTAELLFKYKIAIVVVVLIATLGLAGWVLTVWVPEHIAYPRPQCPFGFSFTTNPSTPTVNSPVNFTAIIGCPVKSVTWTFGDGGVASGNPVSHVYTSAGTFCVTAKAYGAGTVAGTAQVITVEHGSPITSCGVST